MFGLEPDGIQNTMQPRQTFGKEERLCSKAMIDDLFAHGQSFFVYPFKVVFSTIPVEQPQLNPYPARVLFSVPKRRFKLAVDRNKLKRLLREGYRREKYLLYQVLTVEAKQTNLAFVYTGKQILSAHEIRKKIKMVIQRLTLDINKTDTIEP